MSDYARATIRIQDQEHPESGPREAIEALGDLLARKQITPEAISNQVQILRASIEDYLERLADEGVFEEAVFNTPWLTPLSESLRQQQETLIAKARELSAQARVHDDCDQWRQKIEQKFEELAELVLEHESGVSSLIGSQEHWAEL